ncbi:NHL repeat-containing protein [Streptomyces sp. NPDC005529]|uniref:NHL repeat-containing protein n=1 Tax=unclassified Streptomyces TaxID=2593676 RepID=UPI0033A6DD5D
MTTPIPLLPEDVWNQVVDRLDHLTDVAALTSVDRNLYRRLRESPRTWREHLAACTGSQLQQLGRAVPTLHEVVSRLLELRAMTTLAGCAESGSAGDGGPARQGQLHSPEGVAVGPNGTLYVADTYNDRVRLISAEGVITTIAGTGEPGFNGDDLPAHKAQLSSPHAVAVGPDGVLYIADTFNHCIRRVTADGVITTIAGTGEPGFNGDDLPAHEALLSFPTGVAVSLNGAVYIADMSNHRVRRVTTDGVIDTVAGTGRRGFGGDGGPARYAALCDPRGVAAGPDGTVHIAGTSNHRIRRISADGVIDTLIGTGQPGFNGDDAPAQQTSLAAPRGVAVGSNGAVYIADTSNHRIRRIGPDGAICTLAGNGQEGYAGDNGPADLATLFYPRAVAVGPNGLVYIITGHRIRRFGTPH